MKEKSNYTTIHNDLVTSNEMWQSRVEIEHYSVAYFDCIIAFKAL